jgi:hypothetical protein
MTETMRRLYEEAQSSATSIGEEMDEHLSYSAQEEFRFGNPYDCEDDDFDSLTDYYNNH